MRFRSKGTPRGERLASHQRRVVFTIAGFGLLMLVFLASGRGAWLTSMFDGATEQTRQLPAVSDRLMGGSALLSDEINIVPAEAPAFADNDAAHLDKQGIAAMESAVGESSTGVRDVPALLTRTIRDDVLGVLGSEKAAWYGTLELARRLRAEDRMRLPDGQYPLFMDSPQSCRGRAFVIRGRLRGMTKVQLPDGAETFGIRSAYDAWISTRDSGSQVIHVNAIAADPGLPLVARTGSEAPEVVLTGYFFKREGYLAAGRNDAGELALTPLFLAGRIELLPKHTMISRADQMNPWLTWIGLAMLGGVLLLVWQFQISDNVFRGTRTHQLTSPPVKPSFDDVKAVTVQQGLQELEQTAHASHAAPSLL